MPVLDRCDTDPARTEGRVPSGRDAFGAPVLRAAAVGRALAKDLQRLALSGDSAEGAQLGELQGSGHACHRNGEPL